MFLENTVNHTEQFGWIEVICGSMFSGKTEELIRRLKRAQFAKQRIEIFNQLLTQDMTMRWLFLTMQMKFVQHQFL